MKMVKSLLLGTAAGLVAVSAGQAADLPVKAKPVEYVKVCSLYGAGFYYMPGTDMCIKIGGYARAEGGWDYNGSPTWGPLNGNTFQRGTSNVTARARGYITADAREQTAYGTVRGYLAVGLSTSDIGFNNAANIFSANRAFIQWAGITAGLTQSFYDFFSTAASFYRSGYLPGSDTGDGGWWVWAYTAQLGNGLSATISLEERRMTQIINANCAAISVNTISATAGLNGIGGCGTLTPGNYVNSVTNNNTGTGVFGTGGAYGGWQAPDVVGNIRIDQTWGSAQIMAAAHEVNASYYGAASANSTTLQPTTGHPGDKWGFAVAAGLRLNFPMIAQGDYFQTQVNYTQGALKYIFQTPNSNWGSVEGASEAFGVLSDCVYGGTVAAGTATGCELTTAWNVNAHYEHYWTPQWHQSFVGEYSEVKYDNLANAMLCASGFAGPATGVANNGGNFGSTSVAAPGCNMNWKTWGVASRLQWDITKSFYWGVEVLYVDLKGASTGDGLHNFAVSTAGPPTVVDTDHHAWVFTTRIHKDFLP
jgi:hypothetical protein